MSFVTCGGFGGFYLRKLVESHVVDRKLFKFLSHQSCSQPWYRFHAKKSKEYLEGDVKVCLDDRCIFSSNFCSSKKIKAYSIFSEHRALQMIILKIKKMQSQLNFH